MNSDINYCNNGISFAKKYAEIYNKAIYMSDDSLEFDDTDSDEDDSDYEDYVQEEFDYGMFHYRTTPNTRGEITGMVENTKIEDITKISISSIVVHNTSTEIKTYKVTSIGSSAFLGCSYATVQLRLYVSMLLKIVD